MILLTKGSQSNIVLTLDEKRLDETSSYLIKFQHIVTKQVLSTLLSNADDLSPNTARYNEYAIDADSLFTDAPSGHWTYEVFEMVGDQYAQAEAIEVGRMILQNDNRFDFVEYNPSTDQPFKIYDENKRTRS